MRILLANDTATEPHHGCRATSTALRQLLLERFPAAEIVGDHLQAQTVYECLPLRMLRGKLSSQARPFAADHPDLVVMNGEGTLHAQGSPLKQRDGGYLLCFLQAQRAMDLGIPTWIVNHSFFAARRDYLDLARDQYRRLAYTAVREPFSYATISAFSPTNVQQAADCAFLMRLPAPAAHSPLANAIIFTDSSQRWDGTAYARLRQLSALLQTRTGCPVKYVSLYTDQRDTGRAARLGLPYYAFQDTEDFLAHLQRAAFVVSGRYHLAVFAARCGIPFVTFQANTPKNAALHVLLHYQSPCYLPTTLNPEQTADAMHRLWDARDAHHAHLLAQAGRLQALARKNVQGLA